MTIDSTIRIALTNFAEDLRGRSWWGRENECVNRFAFGYLFPLAAPGSEFFSVRQLGIEVAVPQLQVDEGKQRKELVRKDLVIWPEEDMNCWEGSGERNPANVPLSVLEWKANKTSIYDADRQWLKQASKDWPQFWGFAITVDLSQRNFILSAECIHLGQIQNNWLDIK